MHGLFLILLSSKSNHGSPEKWLFLGLGQEIYKMNAEHLGVTKSKKA